jgi:hypothetical protein
MDCLCEVIYSMKGGIVSKKEKQREADASRAFVGSCSGMGTDGTRDAERKPHNSPTRPGGRMGGTVRKLVGNVGILL